MDVSGSSQGSGGPSIGLWLPIVIVGFFVFIVFVSVFVPLWGTGLLSSESMFLPMYLPLLLPVLVPVLILVVVTISLRSDQSIQTNAGHSTTTSLRRGQEVDKERALSILRERYAHGDLTVEEFETQLATLLETETLEETRRTIDRQASRQTDATSTVDSQTETVLETASHAEGNERIEPESVSTEEFERQLTDLIETVEQRTTHGTADADSGSEPSRDE